MLILPEGCVSKSLRIPALELFQRIPNELKQYHRLFYVKILQALLLLLGPPLSSQYFCSCCNYVDETQNVKSVAKSEMTKIYQSFLCIFSEKPVTEEAALLFARNCGAMCYVECSALTQKNLKNVFDFAIIEAMKFKEQKEKKRQRSWKRKKSASAEQKALKFKRKSVAWWRKAFCFV